MKYAILGVSAANLDAATITVAGTVRNVRDLLGIMKNAAIVSDGTNFTYYLHAPFNIQAATVDGTTAATTITIDNKEEEEIKNLVATTITRFVKGKSYLLTNATPAVVPIVPNVKALVANTNAGNDSAVHTASHYLYVAMEDGTPENATSVTGFTFDVDLEAAARNAAAWKARKISDSYSYWSAYSH